VHFVVADDSWKIIYFRVPKAIEGQARVTTSHPEDQVTA
jgi:hypothetical protein